MKLEEFANAKYWPTKTGLAPSTLAGYRCDYRNLILPRWGDVELEQIHPWDIEAWLAPMSHGQAVNALGALRRILRKAEFWGEILIDPTRKSIELPKDRVPYVPEKYDLKETRALLRAFYGHPLEAWVIVSVTSGPRRCESCDLERADFNLRVGKYHIDSGIQKIEGQLVEWFTKTPQSVRDPYLPWCAVERLREILVPGPLCRDEDGKKMDPDRVARMFASHCRRNRLKHVPPKNLRHTAISLMYEAGCEPWFVDQQTGHASGSITQDRYLWSNESACKREIRKLNKLLLE